MLGTKDEEAEICEFSMEQSACGIWQVLGLASEWHEVLAERKKSNARTP